jgi:pimeloyl-ACP methyl ester carboxylesterase
LIALKKKIYIFSGLGADERVFQKLDFSDYSPTFIKWIIPEKNETIQEYAAKLLNQISTHNPILIGLSFGGIVAIEVAKQINAEKIILIASAKTKNEIPFYYRFSGMLHLHNLLPIWLLKSTNFITFWLFGAVSSFDKQLLTQILIDTDPVFLKWAIDKIVSWKNEIVLKNIYHLHGSTDKILPKHFIKCNGVIQNGGHLMTINKAEEINLILKSQIDKL